MKKGISIQRRFRQREVKRVHATIAACIRLEKECEEREEWQGCITYLNSARKEERKLFVYLRSTKPA